MTLAYILITAKTTKEREVFENLEKMVSKNSEIKEVHPLFGEYDFILKIDAKDNNAISHIVTQYIRNIPYVKDTKTFLGTSF